ncbi:hypothetical protein GCM10007927_10100 [Sulfitobacter pacificus]|uniref:Uncharacterized protein n=1 Tax=Sulfitobacter pacificus TaxID=1499314 RepID=A0ABQ5VGJ1_9RHOB|nr:hypothetical protein GCM10007927_10100 [Sulfitobacter pacificus]
MGKQGGGQMGAIRQIQPRGQHIAIMARKGDTLGGHGGSPIRWEKGVRCGTMVQALCQRPHAGVT